MSTPTRDKDHGTTRSKLVEKRPAPSAPGLTRSLTARHGADIGRDEPRIHNGFILLIAYLVVALAFPRTGAFTLVDAAGAQIKLGDLAAAYGVAFGCSRLSTVADNMGRRALPAIFAALLLAATAKGYFEHGEAAVNAARNIAYPFATALAFLALPPERLAIALRKAGMATTVILTLLAMHNFSKYGLGGANVIRYDFTTGQYLSSRVLNGSQAAFLAGVFLVALNLHLRGTPWKHSRFLCILQAAVIIASQQRTVWVATLVGLFILLVGYGSRGLRLLGGAGLFGVVSWFLLDATTGGRFNQSLLRSSEVSSTTGTFGARQDTNSYYMERFSQDDWLHKLFGHQFGGGYARYIDGVLIEWTPHTFYVLIIYTMGLFGLAALIGTLVGFCIGPGIGGRVGKLSLVVFILVFFYGYSPPALLGALAAYCAVRGTITSQGGSPQRGPARWHR